MVADGWEDVTKLAPELIPYLRAAAEGRLLVPRCNVCSRFQFPPRPTCRYCRAESFDWPQVELEGAVYSWTTTYRAPSAELADSVPFTVAIVSLLLPDPVRLVGTLRAAAPAELHAGARVSGCFAGPAQPGRPDLPLLVWRPRGEPGTAGRS